MAIPFFRFLLRAFFRLIARIEVTGMETIPKSGPLIVAGNHLGRLDPLLVYAFINREDIIMLVAEKYGKYAVLRWLVKQVDGIFVDRFKADFRALRIVLNRLEKGGVLVIAPEGTRSPTGALIEGKPGVAYLAAKSGLPVVAAAAIGTEDAAVRDRLPRLRRLEIKIRVGEPFTLPPLPARGREQALQQGTDEIMCRIAVLLPPAYRGVYADHPRLKELLAEGEGLPPAGSQPGRPAQNASATERLSL